MKQLLHRGSIISFFEYCLIFVIIMEFNTPYLYFPIIKSFILFAAISLGLMLILLNGKLKIDVTLVLLIVGAIIPLFNVYSGRLFSYVKLYIIVLPLFYIYYASVLRYGIERAKSLWLKYSNIVFIIAAISLFFWTLGSRMAIIHPTGYVPNHWGTERILPHYYGIYFETQAEKVFSTSESKFIRNSGIFNEAPMFNMILCISLAIESFVREKKSIVKILILIITIITTISTTGYIFLIMLFFIKIYERREKKKRILYFVLIPLLLYVGQFAITSVLENKQETHDASYSSRIRDIQKCINVGVENPILGVGVMHKADEDGDSSINFGYSNSLFGSFAHGGVYLLALYVFSLCVIPFVMLLKKEDRKWAWVMLCFFMLFTFTVSQYKLLTMLFVAYAFAFFSHSMAIKRNKKKCDR